MLIKKRSLSDFITKTHIIYTRKKWQKTN
jgi:hypothetical protein